VTGRARALAWETVPCDPTAQRPVLLFHLDEVTERFPGPCPDLRVEPVRDLAWGPFSHHGPGPITSSPRRVSL